MLNMYKPLLDDDASIATPADGPSPRQIVAESSKNIQTLVRLYFVRHGFEAMDLFILVPLMVVVYDCIEAMDETRSSESALPAGRLASLQSTLVLVAQGLYYQRRNHYPAEALFRVVRGRMSAGEVSMLKSSMNLDDKRGRRAR